MSKSGTIHNWKLGELAYIRDNTHKYTDRELGKKLGGLTKAQVKGARVMYDIKRRKKHFRPAGKGNPKPIGTIVTRKMFGNPIQYIKTEDGWVTLKRHEAKANRTSVWADCPCK